MNKNWTTKNQLRQFAEKAMAKAHIITTKYARPVGVVAIKALLMVVIVNGAALAQGPNPFGGTAGTTRLSNVGSNILVIATWAAFFIGLLSFVLIPVFIKMEWDYKKLVMSGLTGVGGFIIIGSIAYDVVNLSTINISDPTLP